MWSSAGLVVAALYLGVLLFLGWRGYRRRKPGSLNDFYLAGTNLGFVVLLATLYATQYSGNTFLGYTGQAYRIGFVWTMSVGMMMSIVITYLLFAPTLYVQSRRHGYITPADWVQHRFGSNRLTMLVSVIMIIALLNYLYAQFLAMGHFVAGVTDHRLPFWVGVVGLAIIIGVYETLGGMRSVVWTDVVQGLILFFGLATVLAMAWPQISNLESVSRNLLETKPELVNTPTWAQCGTWFSSIMLLGFGAAMYPQAIQRIYAAQSATALRRSIKVMVWMPFVTTLVVLVIGIAAHGVIPEQQGLATDQVMPDFLAVVSRSSVLAQWATAFVLVAVLAAIMSTADSALLSLSSMIACDLIGRSGGFRDDEKRIEKIGKRVSWGLIIAVVLLALSPRLTLWRLLEIKMEILIQVAPIVILGLRSKYLDADAAWKALSIGSGLVVLSFILGISRIGGIHTGTYACAVNLAICLASIRAKKAYA